MGAKLTCIGMHYGIQPGQLSNTLTIDLIHQHVIEPYTALHLGLTLNRYFVFVPDIVHQIMVVIPCKVFPEFNELILMELSQEISIPVKDIDIGQAVAMGSPIQRRCLPSGSLNPWD